MLVLTRKVKDSIMIGDDIKITVLEVKGDHARIGIDAPRDIAVHRLEIYRLIRRNALVEAFRKSGAASPERSADDALRDMGL